MQAVSRYTPYSCVYQPTMKSKFLTAILFALLSFNVFAASPQTFKLSYAQKKDLIDALAKLDGSTVLDKEKISVFIAYQFKPATRIAIAEDIKAISDSLEADVTAWKAYLKSQAIKDETKETSEQKEYIQTLLTTPTEVKLTILDQDDIVGKGDDGNPIPSTTIARLKTILK